MFLHICEFNVSYVKLLTRAVRDIIQNYISDTQVKCSHTYYWKTLKHTTETFSYTLLKCYFTLMCEEIFLFSAHLLCLYYYALYSVLDIYDHIILIALSLLLTSKHERCEQCSWCESHDMNCIVLLLSSSSSLSVCIFNCSIKNTLCEPAVPAVCRRAFHMCASEVILNNDPDSPSSFCVSD